MDSGQAPGGGPVEVPGDVLAAALRATAEGAAARGMHAVLEHGVPVDEAAQPPAGLARVLAWAWRARPERAVDLLAMFLSELHAAAAEPTGPPASRFHLDVALDYVAVGVTGASYLLTDDEADALVARALRELPGLDPRLR